MIHSTPPALTLDTELTLAHAPESVSLARQATEALLRDVGANPDIIDTAILVVSEMVTNGVEHAAPPLALRLSHSQDEATLAIEVSDGGPAAADGAWAASCADGESGRGLTIVHEVSRSHGAYRYAGGQTYWAELPLLP